MTRDELQDRLQEVIEQRDELLAACKGYFEFKTCKFCQNGEMCELCQDAYQQLHDEARAAIGKAEGNHAP